MTTITLHTDIAASVQTCFDLARDIDIHKVSTAKTKEKAIAGRTSGLCEAGDQVTWEAVHFGVKQYLTVEITHMEKYSFFADSMVKGAFKGMQHKHYFKEQEGITRMTDIFEYQTPFGIFGKLFDSMVLKHYMTKFLKQRNKVLKDIAEKQNQH